jgi:hypothetical protein
MLSRTQLNDYIFCPHKFSRQVVNEKYKENSKDNNVKTSIYLHKNNLTSIASEEMKNNVKLSLSEYRSRFTNTFYDEKTATGVNSRSDKGEVYNLLDSEVLLSKLNNFYSHFANQAFIGYNIPIEISISGTNIVYKTFVDFGLINDKKELTFIDIVDMLNPVYIKDKVNYWAHYYISYSYLAASFNKTIKVILLDPDVVDSIEFTFNPGRFDDDYKQLCEMITPITNSYIIRNLNACSKCLIMDECFGKEKKKVNKDVTYGLTL